MNKLIYIANLYNISAYMLKKFVIVVFTTFALTLNVSASSDGDLILKKKMILQK